MYRLFFLFIVITLLNACAWGDSFAPSMNWYFRLPPNTEIQSWQKQDSIGYTDPEQRWKDFQQCGVKKYLNGTLDLNVQYDGMTDKDVTERYQKIATCMKNKGYIALKTSECIDFDKKRLTGKCN